MGRTSKAWGATSDQFAKIAEEGRQVGRPKALKAHEAEDLQAREAADQVPTPAPAPTSAEKPIQAKRTSTSLYLTPAAHQAIRMHAAAKGVRPHRIYDDALRAYFEAHGLGDFNQLNGTEL